MERYIAVSFQPQSDNRCISLQIVVDDKADFCVVIVRLCQLGSDLRDALPKLRVGVMFLVDAKGRTIRKPVDSIDNIIQDGFVKGCFH